VPGAGVPPAAAKQYQEIPDWPWQDSGMYGLESGSGLQTEQ